MKKIFKWLYRNSANLLSASRMLSPLVLFGPWGGSVKVRLISIIILASTDLFDGPLARKIQNEGGIGKFIDAFSDKVMIFSVLGFFFWKSVINPKIIGVIVLGEVIAFSIASFGIYLALEKNRNQWLKIILNHWKVNAPGKLAMVFYFFMAVFVFISNLFSQDEIWTFLQLISFWGGFVFRVISIGYYIIDLNNWQKEAV